jgi:integral membrane protein (TIGR01906 family)
MNDAAPVDTLAGLPGIVKWLAIIAFAIAMPLFLILGNVLNVAGDREFYAAEFPKYDVGAVTGLNPDQLVIVADLFITYLSVPGASLNIEFTLNGQRRPLFNEKEISHMVDVQKLFGLVRQARLVAGAVLLILPLLGLWLGGSAFLPRLGTLMVIGAGVTIGLLALAGVASLFDFTDAFITFHEMAFSNDNWMLDPRTDYLIMLFPEGFWLDATLRIAMLSAIEAVVMGAVGLGITYFGVRR